MNELDARTGPVQPGSKTAPHKEAELIHRLYDAVIDNSLWPEMISELIEHIERASDPASDPANDSANEGAPAAAPTDYRGLVMHFERAMRLSENIVELQERNATLGGVLDSLAVGLCVYDHAGERVYANRAARECGLDRSRLAGLGEEAQLLSAPSAGQLPSLAQVDGARVALISAAALGRASLPLNAAVLAVALPDLSAQSFQDMQRVHYLSAAETGLLTALYRTRNLRAAATACEITYESARTYLKRIYLKTGCADQSSLLLLVERNPLSVIERRAQHEDTANPARRALLLEDGRNLEYFEVGPADGRLLLHFDALTGVALDVLGAAHRYRPHLEALGLRIVVPCRPGTFGSHYRAMSGLSQFTDDLRQLLDHLGAARATVLSQAFGSCSALAFAASAPDRVQQVLLCAPSYPRHEPANWRNMDLFYIIGGVIGRRAPSLLKAIVPYLMRSVMQNTAKYLQRHIARSRCPADIAVLSNPLLQRRIPEVLALRMALGTDGVVQEHHLNAHGWDFELQAVTMPVHIIQGELDNVSDPEGSRKLQAALADGHYYAFPEFGQYLLFTEWPWILEACACDDPAAVIGRAREQAGAASRVATG